jgi:tyrosyl-tRNA synthetase
MILSEWFIWIVILLLGFFDGEGSIYFQKRKPTLFVRIGHTDKDVINQIQDKIGGSVYFDKSENIHRKDAYRWCVASTKTYNFIVKMLPYLVLKKQQAEIAIKFQESIRQCWSGNGLSESEITFKEQCYNEMKKLNQRGKTLF